ncbi:MAG: potassium-transporting ATPase subunit KdpC [Paracoccaceae bacterium]
MLNQFRAPLAMVAAMTALTGLAYPLALTGIARVLAPDAANGSLIERDGAPVGSRLIAQDFAGNAYLHPRPSAAGFAAMPSGASNLGPTSASLRAEVANRRGAWESANGGAAPIDAVTASGSGLDPDISPRNALGQAARIAAARGVTVDEVTRIIAARTEGRWLGLYGQPRVNVLLTNLALDAALPVRPAGTD